MQSFKYLSNFQSSPTLLLRAPSYNLFFLFLAIIQMNDITGKNDNKKAGHATDLSENADSSNMKLKVPE